MLGTIEQMNVVTIQKLETDNSSQRWRKGDINWDDDGDEKDYQLVHEESGKFLTARESSLTVENKGRVTSSNEIFPETWNVEDINLK